MPAGHQLPDSLTTAEDGEADVDGLEIEKAYVEVRLQLLLCKSAESGLLATAAGLVVHLVQQVTAAAA
jgi:hypothetical protein